MSTTNFFGVGIQLAKTECFPFLLYEVHFIYIHSTIFLDFCLYFARCDQDKIAFIEF